MHRIPYTFNDSNDTAAIEADERVGKFGSEFLRQWNALMPFARLMSFERC